MTGLRLTSEAVVEKVASVSSWRLPDSSTPPRDTHSYNITGLTPGSAYYTRVCGNNKMGRGAFVNAAFNQFSTQAIVSRMKPDVIPYGAVLVSTIPASEVVSVFDSSSTLKLTFNQPASVHGSNISNYVVEWWDTDVAPQNTSLSISANAVITGSFRLSYNNDVTDWIPIAATADRVRTELKALYDIRDVQVFRSNAASSGYVYPSIFVVANTSRLS